MVSEKSNWMVLYTSYIYAHICLYIYIYTHIHMWVYIYINLHGCVNLLIFAPYCVNYPSWIDLKLKKKINAWSTHTVTAVGVGWEVPKSPLSLSWADFHLWYNWAVAPLCRVQRLLAPSHRATPVKTNYGSQKGGKYRSASR